MSEHDTIGTIEQSPAASGPAETPAPAREGFLLTSVRFVAFLYVTLLALVALALLLAGVAAGWRPYLVTSGSMVPTMHPGDVVVVEPRSPGQAFDPPTIITFTDPERGLVTHRIVAAQRMDDGEVRYTTKGDANGAPESGTVGAAEVVGSVRFVLRDIGLPLRWAQLGDWGPFGLWAISTLLAVWLAVGLIKPDEGRRAR